MIKRELCKYLTNIYLPLSSARQAYGTVLGNKRWRLIKISSGLKFDLMGVSSRLDISRFKKKKNTTVKLEYTLLFIYFKSFW